jgi:hypothetical protein
VAIELGTMASLESKQHWMTTLELARAYIPHEPMEALRIIRELLPELDQARQRELGRDLELETLVCRAKLAFAMYGTAARRWQEENARREREFREHELADSVPPPLHS